MFMKGIPAIGGSIGFNEQNSGHSCAELPANELLQSMCVHTRLNGAQVMETNPARRPPLRHLQYAKRALAFRMDEEVQVPSSPGGLKKSPVTPQTVQSPLKDAKDPHQLRDLILEKLNEAERKVLLSKLESDGDGTEDLDVITENAKKLSNTEKLDEDNKTLYLITRFQSSFARLHNYRDSGQALASMQATPTAGIWAGINALIVIAVQHKAQQKALIDVLETVVYTGSLLNVYHEWYCKLKPSKLSDALSNDLVQLYAQVYRIVANAILTQAAGSLGRFWKAVLGGNEFAEFTTRCEDLSMRVRDRLRDCDRNETSTWRVKLEQQIDDLEVQFRRGVQKVEDKVDMANLSLSFSKLKVADEATYKSGDSICLDGTRVDILADIMNWAKDSGDPKMIWLNGKAGTGKSTIARTVASNLDGANVGGEKCVVASFFFKRNQENVGNIACLVPTLAKQLAHKMPSLKISIATALRDDAELAGARMEYQFQKLLQFSFESIMQHCPRTERVIFMIDSLDECDDVEGIRIILPLLANLVKISSINIRIMITTRPDHTTQAVIGNMDPQFCVKKELDDMQEGSIENDLRKFFDVKLAQIRDNTGGRRREELGNFWPGESNMEALVHRSKPVFIVASTICRFIDDRNPRRRLQIILDQGSQKFSSHMEKTYLPILRYACLDTHGKKDPDRVQQFSEIVKPLILLDPPLSANALAELLKCSSGEVKEVLDPLRSVLHVSAENSDPIIPYHLSFREFLVDLDGEARAQFGVDEEETHRLLLDKCLDLLRGIFAERGMSEGAIEGGMCGPMCSGTNRSRISRKTIRAHVSEAVEYAARYWPSHLIRSNPGSKEIENVDGFLMAHFLHWIETMSWLGRVMDVGGILNQVLTHAFSEHPTHDLKVFLDDAKRWLRTFAVFIGSFPLQTYFTALVSSPTDSILRVRFQHVIERSMEIRHTPAPDWNHLTQFTATIAGISSVAISEAGNTVAASLNNGYVCLWDADVDTMEGLYCVDDVEDHVHKVFFSSIGDDLVLISSYCVRMINVKKKSKQVLFDKRTHPDSIVGITPDLQLVALELEGNIVLHDVKTHEESFRISENVGQQSPVIFSPDGKMLAFTSSNHSGRVWSTQLKEEMFVLPGGSSHVQCLAFSPDRSRLASGHEDGTVHGYASPSHLVFRPRGEGLVISFVKKDRFIVLVEGKSKYRVRRIAKRASAIACSSGSNKIVIGDPEGNLTLRDLSECSCLQSQRVSSRITAMTALADGHTTAIGTEDVPLQLLDIEKVPYQGRVLEGHTDWVTVMKLSQDGRKLATGSRDNSVLLWDPYQGILISRMKGHSSCVTALAFSPDGYRIASGSNDRTVRVWNAKTGNQESIFTKHLAALRTVTFSPDGSTIVSGDEDGSVWVWDTRDEKQTSCSTRDDAMAICDEHVSFDDKPFARVVTNVFSEDGLTVATLSSASDQNYAVRIWDAGTGDLKSIILGLMFPPTFRFSLVGRVVVAGQWMNTIWRWRAKIETLDLDLYWPNGKAVVLSPCFENHVEDDQNLEPPTGQWFEAQLPDYSAYNGHSNALDPSWSLHGNAMLCYGSCFICSIDSDTSFHASWDHCMILGSFVDELTVIRFKSEWLVKVRELQQNCYCSREWMKTPPFRPL
ncbi:WD40 repeat-like protein [Piedraia hortae CBS 480.64]|uniref:WD40 repeat-like protein n=2 Tax=Piedraia hortae CBS 480.64 TaxID=1314780 RepID=A0A6A7C0Q8_9PEZI|nr:WD40 repeat-like protein [Piedraia hortae CBS 480.64]